METPLSLLSLKGYLSIRRHASHPELLQWEAAEIRWTGTWGWWQMSLFMARVSLVIPILLTVFPEDYSLLLLLLLVITIADICCSYLSPYLLRKWQVCQSPLTKQEKAAKQLALSEIPIRGGSGNCSFTSELLCSIFFSLSCWCRTLCTLEYENSRGQIWRSGRRLISGWPNTVSLLVAQQLP